MSTPRTILPDPRLPLEAPEQEPPGATIAAWGARMPDALAIEQGERRITYAQLELASRRLALALTDAGVAGGDVVVVAGERSPGFVIAMVAVLRSGAVLMMLDRRVPPARRALMLREARAASMVAVGDGLVGDAPSPMLRVSPATGEIDQAVDADRVLPAIAVEAPACLHFTTGTTGTPKAVLSSHRGIAHFLRWMRETYAIGPGERAAQLINPVFVVAIRDILVPLTGGATLCLPPADWADLGAANLARWLAQARITMLNAVPPLLRSWLAAVDEPLAYRVRAVFTSSEPLDATLVDACREAFGPACRIVNLYGATEMSQAKMFYEVPATPRPGIQPVGRGIPQAQGLVVTASGALAGIGEPGEVVIRSPFLALGYVDAPGDARFRRNPFRDDDADRVLATGDRGVYAADGNVTIVGRIDDQIKIRGVRVEPVEVAALLQGHRGVAHCAVVARGEGAARALAAYVVPRDPAPLARELRAWLGERLVEAMVPSSITFLERMPFNASGKVDRGALPEPATPGVAAVAPRDSTEQALIAIWREVLARDDIGVTDDFFDAGGDSVAAARILVRIDTELGASLPLTALFGAPTVADLAAVVKAAAPGVRAGSAA